MHNIQYLNTEDEIKDNTNFVVYQLNKKNSIKIQETLICVGCHFFFLPKLALELPKSILTRMGFCHRKVCLPPTLFYDILTMRHKYCGFINFRWVFNFVDFVVGPNHKIKSHELPKFRPVFLIKFKLHEFKCH